MEAWSAKVLAIVSLFSVMMLFGLLPLRLLRFMESKSRHSEVWIAVLNCFAGGVFLSTSLLHLLPDVRRDIEKILQAGNQTMNFPLGEFIMCMGFFIVMLLENILLECHPHAHSHNHGTNSSCEKDLEPETRSIISSGGSTGSFSFPSYGAVTEENKLFHKSLSKTNFTVVPVDGDQRTNCQISIGDCVVMPTIPRNSLSEQSTLESHDQHDASIHSLRSLVFLLALSTHTIFEGLALGLQDTAQDVLTLLVAVLIHKAVISFTMSIRFAKTLSSQWRVVLYVTLVSLMAPIGVAIGLAVTEAGQHTLATDIASAGLQGLATGTFLYVTFFEILFEQMMNDSSVLKVMAVVVGFSCIAILNLLAVTS